MGSWLRRYPLRSGVVTLIVIVAAIIQILNGLPDLVDRDLPWLGNRVNLGLFGATIWQIAWVVPLVAALGLLVGIYRNSRAGHDAQPERGEANTSASPGSGSI